MVTLTKIHVRYEIKQPYPLYVEPGNSVEGKVFVTNNSLKDKKLKEVAVELYEVYEEKYVDDSGTNYKDVKTPYGRYPLQTRGVINILPSTGFPGSTYRG